MPSLKLNIIANFIGRGWIAIMGLAFVPLYIKFMGIEAYGLVGFSATIQALSSLLDMGLSTTLNRELARLSAHEEKAQESRDLVTGELQLLSVLV
jgi:O-antigen/teichoic acid export membrane protein